MEKVLFLELNEFNADILEKAAIHFPNIQKLVSMRKLSTFTEDTYESDFLEPWVQWVSVHTGIPSVVHQIKHLGDVPDLQNPQIWEALSKNGITSGIWGAMNASKASAENCLFFVPDPWTASESAYPEELNDLLDPLRFASKSYSKPSMKDLKRLFSLFAVNGLFGKVLREVPRLLQNMIRFRGEHFMFISFLDYVSTLLFLKYRKKYNPDFSLIFLNSIAHLQHHHWHESSEKLQIGYAYLDRILGHIFADLKGKDRIVVTNALSQKNTNDEKPWILYRQVEPKSFLSDVGLNCLHIEPHMTHDAHLYFATETDCKKAKKALEGAEIAGQKLFFVESYSDPLKLFYRVTFTDKVASDAQFTLGDKQFDFFKLFKPIVQRTGKHIPHGTIYTNMERLPESMMNHDLFQCFNQHFEERQETCTL